MCPSCTIHIWSYYSPVFFLFSSSDLSSSSCTSSFLPLPLALSLLSLPPLSLILLLFYPLVLLPRPPLRILPPPSCSFSSPSPSSSYSSSSSFLFLSLLFLFLIFLFLFFHFLSCYMCFFNLSCVYSFCFVLLNFTCLRVAGCLLIFLLIKLFFKHIMKHCTTWTRYPDLSGMITGYPDPDGNRHPAVPQFRIYNIKTISH